ncbi:short-chain dehydrogenase/reductase 2 [Purpureocillium lilacinum]|uniref:Short-chain dehydrogenase/reductase 2 n=1 Tax=Purpureocillium lilacinum TaxID=33203 RepID=A0A179GK55_PURLI|nr:short-chain dehydrogenase/reductase 2 [Purpureocillium lilacinum]
MGHPISKVAYTPVSYILSALGQPLISGGLLAAITVPSPLRDTVCNVVQTGAPIHIVHLRSILFGILFLGSVRTASRVLDHRANTNESRSASSRWNFPNEIAVLTGGCGGIGKSIAGLLSARGIQVAALDIQASPPEFDENPNIHYFYCDITSQRSVRDVAQQIRDTLGEPSVLVNNAGISHRKSIIELSRANLEQTFQVNAIAHWTTCQEFLPAMIAANKGHIVAVASLAAFGAMPLQGDYAATKSAILAFHECLIGELKHIHKVDGILNSVVCPGWTRTPIIAKWGPKISEGAMDPERVATRVVEHVVECVGGQSFVPESLGPLSITRALPLWLQAVVRDAAWKLMMNKA